MSFTLGGTVIGRDNIAVGSPTGDENLVNGTFSPQPVRVAETGTYGPTVSCSLSRSSQTVTGTATAHGLTAGGFVAISGSTTADYNREFQVLTTADADTFTFRIEGSPAASPGGTILSRKVRTANNIAPTFL